MTKISCLFIAFYLLIIILPGCGESGKKNFSKEESIISDTTKTSLNILNDRIKTDTNNSVLYHDRAIYFIENEKYNDAFNDVLRAIEIDSAVSDYHVTLSDVYMGTGKFQASVQSLEKAVELNPENIKAFLKLAEVTIVFKDYKKSMGYIEKILKLDELVPKAYFLQGLVFLETGDSIRGIRSFQKSIDIDQDYLDAHLELGSIYAVKKDKLAVDYFNNALNIDPSNTLISYYLAMFYQETAEYENAVKVYNTILTKDPEFFYAYYNIGYIHLVYLNQYKIAIEYFTKAIELSPEYHDAYYNRGFAYELLQDITNSRSDYQKVLDLKPNYEKAINGLNRIDEFLNR